LYQSSTSPAALNVHLHAKQWIAFETDANEVLYGGAAGGGKSHLMRISAIVWCASVPGLQVYLFRRIRDDLIKNHIEGPKGFRALLADWVLNGWCIIVEDEIRFWNGSKIYLCHCKDEKDIYKYQGAEIHVLLIDELTHWTEKMYRFLRNRVRMVGIDVPPQYAGMFPRILCGANPGNIGHLWVKATFVLAKPEFEKWRTPEKEGGMLRQYIPARLDDNPSMTEDDPGYENRLEGLGSQELVKAMRWGDWSVIEGAFFDCWSNEKHVIRPFQIPADWLRFRSVDWGSAKPFSVGWWAVAGDDLSTPSGGASEAGARIPRGALIRYREWYGCVPGQPNTGLKLTAEEVAQGVLAKTTPEETIAYTVADPSMFATDGGPSHAERMMKAGLRGLRPADNKRISQKGALGGWDAMRQRLKGDGERPMIFTFHTCVDSIRTIPALQHDPDRPEDVDTDGEDHAGDEWRYACMSRPWIFKPQPEKEKPRELTYEVGPDGVLRGNMSVMQIVQERMRRKKINE
jgi:hypothetical protein